MDMCMCMYTRACMDMSTDLERGERPEDDVARLVRHRQHGAARHRRLLVACWVGDGLGGGGCVIESRCGHDVCVIRPSDDRHEPERRDKPHCITSWARTAGHGLRELERRARLEVQRRGHAQADAL